ncbi:FMN-dependent NADH-azoreductase [Mycoplasmopsis pullorum]|uniref:FMN dependent NADH:quinone oxidoreductase n=1 Tax=Mycoplasmopsis pullorum TaxID=48003 RepID=A0A1L4FSN3_9BACT|nr:FMN-dependent NADH-azoreductase [Mycoplasmopsis pullorum]APJ38616.1 FMN-dependent NADH-azoreductase [Mycoplasmopsis pullorum]
MSKALFLHANLSSDENSTSFYLEQQFLNEFKKANPESQIEVIDLNDTELAHTYLNKKTFATYWQDVKSDQWIEKLKNVDKLIISLPMINFGPSSVVKNFIDAIAVANKTFSYKYSKKGDAIGLLNNLDVMILATQGAPKDWYLWGSHVTWLEGTWNFLGAKKVDSILLAGTKVAPYNEISPKKLVDENLQLIKEKAQSF